MRFAAPLLLVLATSAPIMAQTPAPSALGGEWVVDLSPKADQSYVKDMVLDLRDDGSVGGSFYDSDIEAGQWKTARGRTCVSFRTSDGEGPYHSAACLNADNSVNGQTWAEHRDFLFNWTAVRKAGGK
ncbi:hypothetical protein BA950_14385 [Erythrobacter sp. SAORIC-644]|jgi:hypothetical protein|nr:hypothetical protein [Erythrobacteraceae bacterium]PNQ74258.1 hypothetical protein BA950_14385 [Erythrobacter sp. SAORIC-644]